MLPIRSLFTTSKNFILFKRFQFKRWALGFPFKHLRPNKDEFLLNQVWDGSIYPNYKGLKKTSSMWKTNLPRTLVKLEFFTDIKIFNLFLYGRPTVQHALTTLPNLIRPLLRSFLDSFKRSVGDGAIYLRGIFILCFTDALLTDDEPIWEPVEWSLVQSWIMFIFAFAWIGENLISSRFGGYTGRDKRVWTAWYKTFWLIEGWYLISLAAAALFVMIPFYHEISYGLPLVVSWWNWYSRVFFFKFISIYSLVLYLAYYLQLNLGNFHWKKSLALIVVINLFLSYLLYTHFLMSFFGYFTDPNWYHKTRLADYVQLSHEPNKWSWGNAKRDHFSYHKSTTVFWFKNDGPFAAALLFFHVAFLLFLFALYFYWLTLLRRVYTTQEITYTYTTFCVAALRQFLYFFMFLYGLIIFSYCLNYWRLPIEYLWVASYPSWSSTFIDVLVNYPSLVLQALSWL